MTPLTAALLVVLGAAPVTSTCKETPDGRSCMVRAGTDLEFELLMKGASRILIVFKQAPFDAPKTRFYLKHSNEMHDCFIVNDKKDATGVFFVSPKNGALFREWTSAACDPRTPDVEGTSPRLVSLFMKQLDEVDAAIEKLSTSMDQLNRKNVAACNAAVSNVKYCDCLGAEFPVGADYAAYSRFLAVDSPSFRARVNAAAPSDSVSIAKQMFKAKEKCGGLILK